MLRALGLTGLSILAACASDRPPLLEDDPRSRAGRQAAQARTLPAPAPASEPVPMPMPAPVSAPAADDAVAEAQAVPAARAPFRPPSAQPGQAAPRADAPAPGNGYAPRAPRIAGAPPPRTDAAGLDDPYFAGEADAVAAVAPGQPARPRVGAPPNVGANTGGATAPGATRATDAPFALRGAAAPELPAARPAAPAAPINAAPAPVSAPPAAPATLAFIPDPQAALDAVNAYRARYGYAPLAYDPLLSQTALDHARDLARRGEVTSVTADGAGVIDRLAARGYRANAAASLVSGGYDAFGDAMTTWRRDRIQRSRLLLPQAREVGLAFVEDPRSPYRYYIEMIVATQ